MKTRFLVLCLALLAFPAFAGVTYRFESDSSGRGADLRGLAAVEGKRVRIEFESGDGMIFKDGSVVLSSDGGATLLLLDPQKKTYYEFSFEQTLEAMGGLIRSLGDMVSFNVENRKVDVQDAGDGGVIEGYPTRKWIIRTSYDLAMNIMGMKSSSHVEMTTESWTTDKVPAESMTFIQQKGLRTGIPDLDELIETHAADVEGFPLRQVVRTSMTQGKKTTTDTTTMQVRDIRIEPIPAARFVLPEGYQKVEPQMPSLEGLQKSLRQ